MATALPITAVQEASSKLRKSSNTLLWERLVIAQQQIVDLQRDQMQFQQQINHKLDEINDTLSQAKGGWRALVAAGVVVSALSGLVAWTLANIFHVTSIH